MAATRKGDIAGKEEEKKGGFEVASISSFREKMLREEKIGHS